jgi:RNase P subunit RPR2
VSIVEIPTCCGRKMKIEANMGNFVMVSCRKCGDVIYIKKGEKKPELIELMG